MTILWLLCCLLWLSFAKGFAPARTLGRSGGLHRRVLATLPSHLLVSVAEGSVNAWSVSGSSLNSEDLASSLFAASLFPYIAFLYFLSRPQSKTPSGGEFGFRFLLVFVFATIPAGIYAKVQYNDILANVDWLHGSAESMLTITNLLIILGWRATRPKAQEPLSSSQSTNLFDGALPILVLLAVATTSSQSFLHPEPANALSLPTWAVHSSSLLEWLLAMKLIWEHAETSGNPRWKGLPWAMIPSHTSGICACTYHFFYNSPAVNWIVALQALLTVVGNSCLALAAYRVSSYDGPVQPAANPKPLEDSDAAFLADMTLRTLAVAAAVKYGELALDLPFEKDPSLAAAAIIVAGTAVNVAKWQSRSREQASSEPLPL